MKPYAIGLDIGIASVGWAVVALDGDETPRGIIDMGSRIFTQAEQPKTGESLAAPRREARSSRRRLRRHRHRNERIKNLIISTGLLSQNELESLFEGKLSDIYALRVRALDEPVTQKELARILIHLSQRRGFRSNRKGAASKEDGKLLEAVSANAARMAENGYRTVGEMMLKDPIFADYKRNHGGEYLATVTRDMVEQEARMIFAAQRGLGSSFASEAFEEAYISILLSQRSFDDGPGGNSPYGGSQIEKMIGKCTFEAGEPRAAKAAYSFEYFNLLERVNHIRIISHGENEPLTAEQRKAVIDAAHRDANLNFEKLRKLLLLSPEQRFNLVRYDGKEANEVEKKEKFCYLKAYHQIRTAVEKAKKGSFASLGVSRRNEIGRVLSCYKTSENIRRELRASGIDEAIIPALEALNFSKFGHLSVKACDKLIPFLEQGMNYNDACAAAGYDFKAHSDTEKTLLLHPKAEDFEDITSPVARRAISQTIKVINAIIRRQGESPTYINIELAREMSKSFTERRELERGMTENRTRNEKIMDSIRTEYGKSNPTGLDLVKLKLYREQDGMCAYSLKHISAERLFEPNYTEIDHIVPYSISFDDSYKNKVLVLTEENRNKSNRLPLQYLTGEKRERFIIWVNNNVRNSRKKELLLKERFTEEDEKRWKERNLQDTKTISRFMLNYLNDHLLFAPSDKRKKRVTAVNGIVTDYMRKRWGITKVREDGDMHHAVDALVIVCTTDAMIQQVSRYAVWRECHYTQGDGVSLAVDPNTGEVIREFPYPWRDFRRELEARTANDPVRVIRDLALPFYLEDDAPKVHPLFVSRMPKRSVTGAAHKDTIKSAKEIESGYVIVKRPLTALKLDKTGEIADYYAPESDRLLYEALKARLLAYGGDGAKAFAAPFYKPKSDGTPGPVVNKVKLCEVSTLNVPVQNGTAVADNDSMVRIDVFKVEGDGYYIVPIYVADTLKPELPNRACVANRPYSEWKEMKEEDFIFSLYPNDLVKVTHKKFLTLTRNMKESTLPKTYCTKSERMYYIGTNINTGAIGCTNHDNSYGISSLGVKTLESFEKYTVDVLGEYHPVTKETRRPFVFKKG